MKRVATGSVSERYPTSLLTQIPKNFTLNMYGFFSNCSVNYLIFKNLQAKTLYGVRL